MQTPFTIKNWAADDRPREKLLRKGVAALSDAELIAILLGSGTRDESAVDLAKRVLGTFNNNLNELGKCTVSDLQKNKGIGEAKAVTIISAMELGRRRSRSHVQERKQVSGSKDVFHFFHPLLADLPHEEFWVLFLNRANKVIEPYKLSQGGLSGTVIDVRMILKMALDKLASHLILAHNHPSGNIQPSDADTKITRNLKEAASLMEIKLLDHIIIACDKYYSFADEGII